MKFINSIAPIFFLCLAVFMAVFGVHQITEGNIGWAVYDFGAMSVDLVMAYLWLNFD